MSRLNDEFDAMWKQERAPFIESDYDYDEGIEECTCDIEESTCPLHGEDVL